MTFASTGGPTAYTSAAKGTIYAEFKVPKSSLIQGEKPNWYKVIGPNANYGHKALLNRQGRQMLPEVRKISSICKLKNGVMKDLEWFKKEVAPLLVDYEIEYRYYNQGDFGSLNQIIFDS